MNYSVTYIGIFVSVIALIVEKLGLNILPGEIETTVLVITQLVGAVIALIGRYRKGDLKISGVRKP